MKEDKIVLHGIVKKVLPDFRFAIEINQGDTYLEVLGYGSGNLRRSKKNIQAGDTVEVEISVYDMKRGRVIRRLS